MFKQADVTQIDIALLKPPKPSQLEEYNFIYIVYQLKTIEVSILNVQVPVVDAPDPEVTSVSEVILEKEFFELSSISQPDRTQDKLEKEK